MIIKPVRRGGFQAFSDYLAGEVDNRHENEAVTLISDSLGIGNINDFCIVADRIAEPRRGGQYPLKKPIEHISIRTRKGDILTPEMIRGKLPKLLKKLGYDRCPWILVQHIKGGEPHYHLGIVRIDENGKVPNPKSENICFELAQKFARELGFKPALEGAGGSRYGQEKDRLARLWAATAKLSPAARLNRFKQAGFTPAKHDRRDEAVFVDCHGQPHSLHRIPGIKEMGLKQADITSAFGLDKAKLAALPSIKGVRATITRRKANVRQTRKTNIRQHAPGALRTVTRGGRVYQNSMWHMQKRGRSDGNDPRPNAGNLLLLALLGLSSLNKRDKLQPEGGTGRPVVKRKKKSPRPPTGGPKLRASRGWWVGARAEGVYKSMIAAGASPEWAQLAVEAVYIEEEQRFAAEQRYLDWVQGEGKTNKQSLSAPQPQGRF